MNLHLPYQLFHQLKEGILICDEANQICYANLTAQNMLAFETEKEYLHQNIYDKLSSSNLEETVLLKKHTQAAYQSGTVSSTMIIHPSRVANQSNAFELRICPYHNNEHTIVATAYMLQPLEEEITPTKETIQQQLHTAKQELEEFAYIISHDLKAPVRAIITLATWISEDYGDSFDEMGKEQLQLLSSRVKRMHDLIDGVLQYSRIGRFTQAPSPVSLKKLLPKILTAVGFPAHIHFESVGELPTLLVNELRIYELFYYLIKNSVEFNDKEKGWVKLTTVRTEEQIIFHISDNGMGISERYKDRVFKIFQTLSGDNLGLGLTLAKKIVRLYDGHISLTSKPTVGTTVNVYLPIKIMQV